MIALTTCKGKNVQTSLRDGLYVTTQSKDLSFCRHVTHQGSPDCAGPGKQRLKLAVALDKPPDLPYLTSLDPVVDVR